MNIRNANLSFGSMSYGNNPQEIDLHHAEASSCTVQAIHDWHKNGNGWAGIGYHYFVRKNGEIWKGRPDNAIGAHVAGHNTNTLGVCAEGSYMTETMPQDQKNAIIELGRYLKSKYGINKVYGHREVGSSNCPGTNYPLNEIRNAILGGSFSGSVSTSSSSSSSSNSGIVYGQGGAGGKSYYNVKEVQTMLTKIGYNCNGIDGIWGAGTLNAVRCFQKDCGLTVDGIVGNNTYRRIKANYQAILDKEKGISKPSTNSNGLYRVRKSWSDSKSQVGAYKDINNAKEECNKHTGYSVFDANGKVVYSKANRSTPEKEKPSTSAKNSIVGQSQVSAEQMAQFVLKNNSKPNITCTIQELAKLFSEEGAKEGIRGDIAFCQAIKETGFFKYGGDVKSGQNNYAGIGATGGGVGGAKFCTPRQGVQAQIQHLKAYANKEALKQSQVDPRFGLVTRGIAPNWEDLNGKWAVPGTNYGQEILKLFNLMKQIKIEKVTKAENSSLILYYGDFDKKGAEILSDKINVPYMALRDFKDYNFKTLFNKIYMVGGTEKTIDNCVSFAGKDRLDTLQQVLDYIK
ncbi:N-acetylmuramoyl-L-alanine amidase [Clostridium oceanicum]|uniref:N-acetylmuramoyl-L-alanine amidase n=1 Tax=Clostridium oceanicum TaxID=1543 RepID=A0ABN1JD30_9CLOT